jgi:hypothetical protein
MVAFTSVHSRIHFCVKGENLPLQSHRLLEVTAVVEHRIRKLKAEAIQEDIATIRRAAINDNPLVIAAAKVRGILDGITLAIQLIRDKSVFPANDVKQIHDPSPRLYLPGGGERNVTDISGKSRRRWNEAPELGTPLQSQASSPVQDKSEGSEQVRYDRDEDTTRVSVIGEQSIGVSSDTGEQTVDEQAKESKDSKTVSKAHSITAHSGERIGEQSPENGESHDKQQLADEPVNESEDEYIRGELCAPEGEQRAGLKNGANDDGSVQSAYNVVGKSEQKGEQPAQVILLSTAHRNGPSTSDEQTPDEQSAQWLKSLLPEASNGNGWWEVRTKPKGFVLMFRWRDPDLQVLTLQSVTRDQIEQFKQIDSEDEPKVE